MLAMGEFSACPAAEDPADVAAMDEKALLAPSRLITQEACEISRRAVQQTASEKVRDFARRAATRSESFDKKLTDLAKAAGGGEPQVGSKLLLQRLSAIEKLQGAAFDPDYLKLKLDFHGEHIAIYERLAKLVTTEPVRDFARDALAEVRAHLKSAQELAAPMIPHAKPLVK